MRGIAALAVVVSHAVEWGAGLGGFAVEAFFVLSGYLNGTILLNGENPHSFYLKRAARIIPLYVVVCVVIAETSAVDIPIWVFFAPDLMASTRPIGGIAATVLWTIGVEVWAYLLLPVAVRNRRLAPMLVVLAPLTRLFLHVMRGEFILSEIYTTALSGAPYHLVLCRIDGIMWGFVAARWFKEHRDDAAAVVARSRGLAFCVVGLLLGVRLGLCWALPVWQGSGPIWSIFINPVGIAACAALVLYLATGAPVPWLLRQRVVGWLGTISYGTYLLHCFVVLRIGGFRTHALGELLVTIVCTWALAAASWYCFEQHIVRAVGAAIRAARPREAIVR